MDIKSLKIDNLKKDEVYEVGRIMLIAYAPLILLIFAFFTYTNPHLLEIMVIGGGIAIGGDIVMIYLISKKISKSSNLNKIESMDQKRGLEKPLSSSNSISSGILLSFLFFITFGILGMIFRYGDPLSILFFTMSLISFGIFLCFLLSTEKSKKELPPNLRRSLFGVSIGVTIMIWSIMIFSNFKIDWVIFISVMIMVISFGTTIVSLGGILYFSFKQYQKAHENSNENEGHLKEIG